MAYSAERVIRAIQRIWDRNCTLSRQTWQNLSIQKILSIEVDFESVVRRYSSYFRKAGKIHRKQRNNNYSNHQNFSTLATSFLFFKICFDVPSSSTSHVSHLRTFIFLLQMSQKQCSVNFIFLTLWRKFSKKNLEFTVGCAIKTHKNTKSESIKFTQRSYSLINFFLSFHSFDFEKSFFPNFKR